MIRHFIELFDLSAEAAVDLIDRAIELKRHDQQGHRPPYLEGRTLGLIFEKPSLRTRVSFEAAIAQLGGNAIFLNGKDVGMGVREASPTSHALSANTWMCLPFAPSRTRRSKPWPSMPRFRS